MIKILNKTGTIRFQLTLWYVFFLAITVLSFSLYLHWQLQYSLSSEVDNELQVAVSQLLINVNDTADPPVLYTTSESAVENLNQSRFAIRLVNEQGNVTDEMGDFPNLSVSTFMLPAFETVEINGIPWRIYTQRLETRTKRLKVWLQMAQSLNTIYDAQNNLLRLIVIGLPLILIAATFGGVFMANRALHPVDTITRTVQVLNATDLARRIEYDGPLDELGRLTQTLNSMLARLQTAFDTERQFTADASHELRTPLTAIKGQIGVTLNRQRTVEEYQSTLHHIERETDRLIHLTNDLLFLARLEALPQHRQPESINLSDLLEVVAEQMRPLAETKHIALRTEVPDRLSVSGIPDHLIRLFLNLIDNAIKFTSPNGHITLSAQKNANEVLVCVQDDGSGIAAEHLPNLFNRFYRVERERSSKIGGTGLGLAIAYQIARQQHGEITVKSELGTGTSFILSLPTIVNP